MAKAKNPVLEIVFVLFTLLLFHTPQALATPTNPAPIVNIDLHMDEVINAINNAYNGVTGQLGGINDAVTQLAQEIVKALFGFLGDQLITITTPLINLEEDMITTNPDVTPMNGIWTIVVTIISALYLIVFLIAGFMFLIGSIDSSARATAKKWLKNAIFMIVTISVSFEFYKIILELMTAITQYMVQDTSVIQVGALDSINILLLLFLSLIAILSFATLFLRYLFLLCGAALFPIALFFYFIPPLRPWGSILLNLIGAALLMQVIDVIIFIASTLVWQQFPGHDIMTGLAPTMAFLMIGTINTIVIVFALAKAAITALNTSPTLSAVVNVVAAPIKDATKLVLVAA
ncbi:MAG TPA: hypothetical protein VJG83_02570 [archaeon]|nr:hypothetical protein [archaeon]